MLERDRRRTERKVAEDREKLTRKLRHSADQQQLEAAHGRETHESRGDNQDSIEPQRDRLDAESFAEPNSATDGATGDTVSVAPPGSWLRDASKCWEGNRPDTDPLSSCLFLSHPQLHSQKSSEAHRPGGLESSDVIGANFHHFPSNISLRFMY